MDDGWQPIETAPKDGTKVDLWCINEAGEGYRRVNCSWGEMCHWTGLHFSGWQNMASLYREMKPTHWRPLPEPPK